MATIGNQSGSPDMDYSAGFTGVTIALRVTMSEAASGVNSINFYGDVGTGATVYAAIYDNTGTDALVTSESAGYTTTGTQWHSISLTTASLTSGTEYILALHALGGTCLCSKENGASITLTCDDNYANFYDSGWQSTATPNPGDADVSYNNYEIYLDYTAGAAGGAGKSNPLQGPLGGPLAGGL